VAVVRLRDRSKVNMIVQNKLVLVHPDMTLPSNDIKQSSHSLTLLPTIPQSSLSNIVLSSNCPLFPHLHSVFKLLSPEFLFSVTIFHLGLEFKDERGEEIELYIFRTARHQSEILTKQAHAFLINVDQFPWHGFNVLLC
jgi:hypothetical protein